MNDISFEITTVINNIYQAYCDDNFKSVVQLCESAVSSHNNIPDILAIYASIQLHCGKRDKARQTIEKARQINADNAFVLASEANIDAYEDKLNNVVNAANRALEFGRENPWIFYWCLIVYESAGDYSAALSIALQWSELYPDDVLAATTKYNILKSYGHDEDAIIALHDIETRFMTSSAFKLIQAKKLLHDECVNDAIRLLEESVELHPGSSDLRAWLADAYMHAQDHKLADRMARIALDINPGNAKAMSVLAVSSVGLGHAEEGAKWMKRSREATPLICMNPEFSKALELIRNGWDGIPELVDPLTKSLSPTVAATALTQQISALFKLHRIEEAEVALARLAKFPNTEAIIFMYKTKLLGEQGKVDDEIVLLKECINKRYAMSLHRA